MLGALVLVAVSLTLAQPADLDEALRAADAEARAGRVEHAAALFEVALARAAAGDPRRPRILLTLARLATRRGDTDAAIRRATEAAGLYETQGEPARAADARNTAGLAALNAARYGEAQVHFSLAVRISEATGDGNGHAEQLSNLGNAHYFAGQYDDAARAYRDAASIVVEHGAEPWAARRRRIVAANEAALHQRLGRYGDALAIYLEAGGATDLTPEERAQMLVNEGALYRRLGDPYKALDAYARARDLLAGADRKDGEIAAISNTGIALALDLDRHQEAIRTFTDALQLATSLGQPREQLLATLYRGEAELAAGQRQEAAADFEASRAAAERLQLPEEQWKALYGLARERRLAGDLAAARQLLDQAVAVVESLRETLALTSSRADFFQDKRAVYDERIALGLDTDAPGEIFSLVERSRARAWRDRLGLKGEVDVTAVQQRLDATTRLLSYWISPAGSALVTVSRDAVRVHRLELPAEAMEAFGRALRDPATDAWSGLAHDLARALLPEGLAAGVTRLIVVPDGALGLLPFEVLALGDGPIVSRVSVRLIPTAAALVFDASAGSAGWRAPWARTLTALGDPVPGVAAPGEATTIRLPNSGAEVRDIASLLGGRHDIHVGAENQKSIMLAALQRPSLVLHLATHGVADTMVAERSRLLFSPPRSGGRMESLYLREVYGLKLSGVELAVLSACDTELGPVLRGEGVQAFGRALLAAGARSAVTTLWRVPDEATAAFMHVFYARLQAGDDRAEALAFAKRALLGSPVLAHPHYWAPFVLTGSGGPLPRAPRWSTIGGACLAIAGIALAARVLHRR